MKGKISMFVFIIVLGSILTTTLVAVDTYTKPLIEKNQELKRKASILHAFEIPYYKKEMIDQVFLENIRGRGSEEKKYYLSKDGRIAFLFIGAGLWGPVEGVLAMDKDMKFIKRVEIMHQEETPGLGSRIAERAFLTQFSNKAFTPQLILVAEGRSQANNEIDGITGATMSSKAFIEILNAHYKEFSQIVSGE